MSTNPIATVSPPSSLAMAKMNNEGELQPGYSTSNRYRLQVNPKDAHNSIDSSLLTYQNNINHNNNIHYHHNNNNSNNNNHHHNNNDSGSHGKRQRRGNHYKNINHHGIMHRRKEKEPEMVERRNERERMRVRLVNDAFKLLRSHIPVDPRQKKLSKVNTLRLAIQYIKYLQRLIETNPQPQSS
ncbi:Achaete-scute-like protein 5 [Trichoplax sp. H2]|nr:Achaete-scute-like protein 5 [Trichoplax sp. H2]|eukprot:RDD43744.1 Achaete-scute-like protein 5 [Trichoplax sp. H2]